MGRGVEDGVAIEKGRKKEKKREKEREERPARNVWRERERVMGREGTERVRE